ncbi:catalase [Kytococcus sedentarius]|uniref:catalase n=1 Tax=Kytococcus sedentarius TaxID=1276 RepID=UPI0035BC27E2
METNRGHFQSGEHLTNAHGVRVPDTDHTLKAGRRGPSLIQDQHFREKVTAFDHERIPERAVHARGVGAHGTFRSNGAAAGLTRAGFLQAGVETPVFTRFSTVLGSRGSADTPRDTRGFAVKFYTEEGNYDLVGNNIPVFFIQDAIKFPDVVHAAKPEPDTEVPQAASAHDTFWDFVSMHTEAQHHTMWNMSDRGIPRSLRTMEGFGVHTFRLVNAEGETSLVKFHWKPRAGVHSTLWPEAQAIMGNDPDFHRRDLTTAIDSGAAPEWDLGVQVFPDTPEQVFEGIDLLDPTKFVPEELAPVQVIGTMTLDRNVDNFFAETEQVAFCPSHLVPGIDLTDDPLLQGRLFSYLDTQLSRLGGPNFHQLPINRAREAEVNTHQRDGMHQMAVHTGKVAYTPQGAADPAEVPWHPGLVNSPGADKGVEYVPGVLIELPRPVEGVKERALAASFDDHFTQVRMFYRSLSEVEQAHVADAYSFELGKCTMPHVVDRQLGHLAVIDTDLAATVAENLGRDTPQADAGATVQDMAPSPAVSQVGDTWPVDGRVVGLLVCGECDIEKVAAAKKAVEDAGMVPMLVAPKGGLLQGREGLMVDRTPLTAASIEFEAVLVGDHADDLPRGLRNLVGEAWHHGKAVGGWGDGAAFVVDAVPEADAGVVQATGPQDAVDAVVQLLGEHRVWDRLAKAPEKDLP